MDIQEKKRIRFEFLKELYEITNGSQFTMVNQWALGEGLGLDRLSIDNLVEYLVGKHLVKRMAVGHVGITHYGVVEIEQAMTNPDKPTDHFLPLNFVYVNQMTNSQIQQGSTNSSQTLALNVQPEAERQFREDLEKLKAELEKVNLKADDQEQVAADMLSIEGQLKAKNPKWNVVKECLHTVRNIAEGTAAGLIANGMWLAMFGH